MVPPVKKRPEDLSANGVLAKHQVIQNKPFISSILHDGACEMLAGFQHLTVIALFQ